MLIYCLSINNYRSPINNYRLTITKYRFTIKTPTPRTCRGREARTRAEDILPKRTRPKPPSILSTQPDRAEADKISTERRGHPAEQIRPRPESARRGHPAEARTHHSRREIRPQPRTPRQHTITAREPAEPISRTD